MFLFSSYARAQNRHSGNSSAITDTYYEEDKPPCILETKYFPGPDGSNAIAIQLAFPMTYHKTATQGIGYYQATNLTLPPGNAIVSKGGPVVFRGGSTVSLPGNTIVRGTAQAVSIKKLPATTRSTHVAPWNSPKIIIKSPNQNVLSQPLIDLEGVTDKPLRRVWFDIVNSAQRLENQKGFVTDSYFDTSLGAVTSNYFQCFDMALSPGTNLVALHCEDSYGNRVTTNLVYVLDLIQDKTPPKISVQWPNPNHEVSGKSFTAHGSLDDNCAQIRCQISSEGVTNAATGSVERNGRFWIEGVPLVGKTNSLTLTATDAAGNSSTTNLTVIRSETRLIVDPVPPPQLWQLQVKVTGNVDPPDQEVRVNGRRAVVKPDGSWAAKGIPLDQDGVAIFEATAMPKTLVPRELKTASESPDLVVPKESVLIQTKYIPIGVLLNATQPTYGTFKLQLSDVAGKSFVLCASTNLVDWTPILTNRNSGEVFDYTDTNVMDYGARFFRVTPAD